MDAEDWLDLFKILIYIAVIGTAVYLLRGEISALRAVW